MKKEENPFTDNELWEMECMQRQFPEHTRDEILWAFRTCQGERKRPGAVAACVERKLRKKQP